MKSHNLLKTIFLGFLVFCMGCEESFLEQKSPDGITVDNYWQTKEDAVEALSAVYSQLECFTGWTPFIENRMVAVYYTSDMVQPGSDAYNYPNWTSVYNFTNEFGNATLASWWRGQYRGINFANQVIEKVGLMTENQISEEDRGQVIAEARFLRGYFHFRVLSYFEEVVIRDKPTVNEIINKAISPRSEVYDFILKDLEAALVLPEQWDGENIGRVTKGAALAYLGKVYMFRAGEETDLKKEWMTKAMNSFKEVVDLNVYDLEPDFYGMFTGEKENSPESVFELQLSPVDENGAWYKIKYHYNIAASELGLYGEIYGNQRLVDELTKDGKVSSEGLYDARAYATCFFNCDYFNDPEAKRIYGYTYNQIFGKDSKTVGFRKYLPTNINMLYTNSDINVPLMRYADVLLMYAEVSNELGHPEIAIPIIDDIRLRHGNMPAMKGTTQSDVREQIIHERVMEFTLEGQRFQDLRRWGMLEEVMKEAGRKNYTSDHAYYPIPEEEVRANSEIDF